MTRKLTFLILVLLALISGPGWGQTRETLTTTLANADIVAAGDASGGYTTWTLTDGNDFDYYAYAIKNYHSKTTSSYHFLQIKKYASNIAYYIQLPEFSGAIQSITMTVSSASKPMTEGGNTATLYFSNSNSTSSAGTGVVSGTGASSVTIDASSLNLNTGYITASGAVRIWNIETTYLGTPSTDPAINADDEVNLAYDETSGSIPYTISNQVDGVELEANLEEGATWITDLTVGDESVTFNTTANDSYDSRSAEITLSYEGAEDVVVTVTQAGIPVPTINAENVTIEQDATSGVIAYTIVNAVDGQSLTAEITTGDWISNLAVDAENGQVTFDAAVNTGAARTATVTLKYTGATDKVVTVTQKKFAVDYATLPFSYDGGKDNLPDGLTQNGLGSDYSSSPKMKFDGTGDYLILKINENPGTLSFKIKGNGFSGGTFKLQTSADGITYTDKKSYTTLGDTQTETIADLNASVRYIKWIYTNKSSGNVALGDINLAKEGVKIPTFSIEGGNYWAYQSVALSQADSKPIYYTTNGVNPTANGTLYSEAISVISTCTIKAAAQDGTEWSDVVSATYKIAQTYTTAEVVNGIEEDDIPVIVSMDNWTIESINGNSMNVNDGTSSLQIYDYNIPETYAVGGKLSGSLKAVWTIQYNGEVKNIQNWSDINYSAPTFVIEIDDEIENGTIEATPTTAPADTEISFSVTPNEGYRMVANSLIVLDATGDDVDFTGDNPYTFIMPASDVTISAEFELIPTTQYTYSYSINGIIGQGISVPVGTEITLADGSDLNTEFSFAGWTTDASDVEHILAVGSDYTIHDNVVLYAVYAKEEQGYEENVVIVDGSTLNSTATTTETTQVIDGISYKFSSGAKKQAVQTNAENFFRAGDAVLIGKSGAFIHNDNPFGNGITKFEIYANKGASTKVSVGVYFSANEITAYSTGENTWTATLSTEDHVYDASEKLPIDAKYFWYQVTNANNSQIQFRITYLDQTVSHNSYTRVFLNETATANITISGPSIIPADSTLNMGAYTLANATAANLIIEDGGQLIHHNAGVVATVQKNITAYADEEVNDGYYLIANPTERVPNDEYDVLDGATSGFDLYTFDPTEESEWRNKVGTVSRIPFERTVGYLFAVPNDRTMSFRGSILPAGTMDIDLVYAEEGDGIDFPGFNLLGNPYACNAYVNKPALRLDDTGSEFIAVVGAINPCEGFFVEARSDDRTVTISTEEPGTAPSSLSLTVSQNRGQAIDRAIVSFNDNSNLHKFMLNPAHTNIRLAKNGEEFAALSSDAEGEVPVNFKAEKNGSYTITVNTENVDAEYLHLIDNMTGMDTDLLSTPSYTFEAKTSDYASRFKLVFNVKNEEANSSSDNNFAFMSDGNLVISNIEGEATLQIVDQLGRVLSTETVSGSYNKALDLNAGLYIINLNGMTQKIVVK